MDDDGRLRDDGGRGVRGVNGREGIAVLFGYWACVTDLICIVPRTGHLPHKIKKTNAYHWDIKKTDKIEGHRRLASEFQSAVMSKFSRTLEQTAESSRKVGYVAAAAFRLLFSYLREPGLVPGGVNRIFSCEYRAGRCRWLADFIGDFPFPPSLHFGAVPYPAHFALTGSQDLDVNSRPNLSILYSTWPLVWGFSRGTPVSLAAAFRRPSIFVSFHTHWLRKPCFEALIKISQFST
ncbi:hypothetical protein PR048_015027 [Dryococelus australis]|uniref:Uncharacterized protein n=1 Tax=Dryococelus australis TaxID=614101 RepID=A0ABQ9HFS8_9NEOP|nr:hypothetical protein PR048_015027 [Dryococelus australis]